VVVGKDRRRVIVIVEMSVRGHICIGIECMTGMASVPDGDKGDREGEGDTGCGVGDEGKVV